jgi:hypothetical protein
MGQSGDDRHGADGPPPPPEPPSLTAFGPPRFGPPGFDPTVHWPPPKPNDRRSSKSVWVGWVLAVIGIAAFILIAVTVGFPAAVACSGVAVLLYAVLLLVMGKTAPLAPRFIGRSGSSVAARVLALGMGILAAYAFISAIEFQTATFLSLDVSFALDVGFGCCFLLAGFLAWRKVSRDPSHPEHGKRPYYIGGKVPVTRLGAAAAFVGVTSLLATWLLLGAFLSVPAVTIPLGLVAIGLGLAAFVRAWVRGSASRAVPVAAVLTGLATLGMTVAVASTGSDIQGIACVTLSNCVGVGGSPNGGFVVSVINGTRGSVVSIPGSVTLNGIACPTPTYCVAAGAGGGNSGGVVVTLAKAGSHEWTFGPVQHVSAVLNGVACASMTACVAVGDGAVVITAGRVGSFRPVSAGVRLEAVACPTPSECEAVGAINPDAGNGPAVWVTIRNGVIGTVNHVKGAASLDAIACPSSTTCLAVGQGTKTITISGTFAGGNFTYWGTVGGLLPITAGMAGTLQMMTAVSNGDSISCPTAADCVVVGSATGGSGPSPALVVLQEGRIGVARILEGGTVQPEIACVARDCLLTGSPRDDGAAIVSIP